MSFLFFDTAVPDIPDDISPTSPTSPYPNGTDARSVKDPLPAGLGLPWNKFPDVRPEPEIAEADVSKDPTGNEFDAIGYNRDACGPPVLAIALIDFHHTKGPLVEALHQAEEFGPASPVAGHAPGVVEKGPAYPDLDSWATTESRVSITHEDIDDVLSSDVPLLAIPDGAHTSNADFVFFTTASKRGVLIFGVAVILTLRSDQLKHKDEDVVRPYVQKSVALLSQTPFYGLILSRLFPVARALFKQRDFRGTSILGDFLAQLNRSLPAETIQEAELYQSLDFIKEIPILTMLRKEIFCVLKAILLEAKVVIYSERSGVSSSVVLMLLSMIPGLLWSGFNSDGFGRWRYTFKKYGFPMRVFHEKFPMYPYFCLHQMGKIADAKGYVIGVTNRLLGLEPGSRSALADYHPEVIFDVDRINLAIDPRLKAAVEPSEIEAELAEGIADLLPPLPEPQKHDSIKWRRTSHTPGAPMIQKKKQADPFDALDWLAAPDHTSEVASQGGSPAARRDSISSSRVDGEEATDPPPPPISTTTSKNLPLPPTEENMPSSVKVHAMDKSDTSSEGLADIDEQPTAADEKHFSDIADSGVADALDDIDPLISRDDDMVVHWATSVDAARSTFWKHFQEFLEAAAIVAGPKRSATHLAAAAGVAGGPPAEMGKYVGSEFVRRWCETKSCQNWLRKHRLPVSKDQENAIDENLKETEGVLTLPNGDEYLGGLERGRRHGFGTYTQRVRKALGPDGVIDVKYEGQWVGGLRQGHGFLTCEDLEFCYDGAWLRDQRTGEGKLISRTAKYAGGFLDNEYHGQGTLVDADGNVYDGEFERGEFHGMGKYKTSAVSGGGASGSAEGVKAEVYTGEWRRGKRCGQGQQLYSSGAIYVGMWIDDKFQGQGRYIYPDGSDWDGEWHAGKKHGSGCASRAASGGFDSLALPSGQPPADLPLASLPDAAGDTADRPVKSLEAEWNHDELLMHVPVFVYYARSDGPCCKYHGLISSSGLPSGYVSNFFVFNRTRVAILFIFFSS